MAPAQHVNTRPPHPFVYTLLIAPFGAVGGYVTVAMAFLATRFGLSVEDGAILVAAGMFPHVWKFFWAPIADTTLTRKRWYRISSALCAVGITAMSAIPLSKQNLHVLEVVIFITNIACTFLGMAVEGLMAHATPENQRGRVGGWFQAGNLGGTGMGGGAGLFMATHLPSPWMSGAALGILFIAVAFCLRFVPEAAIDAGAPTPPAEMKGVPVELPVEPAPRVQSLGLVAAMKGVAIEMWEMIKSRAGLLCVTLCILPIGTGAATNVLSQAEVAAKWGVDENTVSLVNGLLNGFISALGCLAGGEICARFSSRKTYAAVGLLMAGVAVAMALFPFVPSNYVFFILAYAFVTGLAYASFTGFVLEAIGRGAAATKYNGFASISNAPITYMGLVLAWAFTKYGAKGMLFTEAIAGVLGIVVLAVVATALRERKQRSLA